MTVNHLAQPLGVRLTQLPHHTVPKWSKGAVCKTAIHEFKSHQCVLYGVLAQLVQSACLSRRKSGIQIQPDYIRVYSSNWLEQLVCNQQVEGSSLLQIHFIGSQYKGYYRWLLTTQYWFDSSTASTFMHSQYNGYYLGFVIQRSQFDSGRVLQRK